MHIMKATITVQQAKKLVDAALPPGLPDDLMQATPHQAWAAARRNMLTMLADYEFEYEEDSEAEDEKTIFLSAYVPLFEELDDLHLQHLVDEVVCTTVDKCGSQEPVDVINNGGYADQLEYLVRVLGPEQAKVAFADKVWDGKQLAFPNDYNNAAITFNGNTVTWVSNLPCIVSLV